MTEQWKTLASVASQDVVDALREAYRLGLNVGLANKVTEGTFEWAMQQMRQGKTVRRENSVFQMRLISGRLSSAVTGRTISSVGIDFEHLDATDWQIVPEPKLEPEGHDIVWAVEQVRQGKRVRRKAWGAGNFLTIGQAMVNVYDAIKTDWVLAPEGESR